MFPIWWELTLSASNAFGGGTGPRRQGPWGQVGADTNPAASVALDPQAICGPAQQPLKRPRTKGRTDEGRTNEHSRLFATFTGANRARSWSVRWPVGGDPSPITGPDP